MSILITGAGGFIGSNLAEYFVNQGEKVIGLDNLSNGSIKYLKSINSNSNFIFIEADLLKPKTYIENIKNTHSIEPISEVWHLAANSDIPLGISDSKIDLDDTFLTTYKVLELMKQLKIKTIFFASSSAIYGNISDRKLTEDIGPLLPISNYGAMKLASEAIISAAVESYLEKAYIFRFPNVIGIPATHGVIYDFINKLKQTPNELHVLGNGTQQKTYLHVDELISSMIYIRSDVNEKINLYNIASNDNGVTVKFIAEEVIRIVSPNANIIYGKENKGWTGDVPKFFYSTKKLTNIGYTSKINSKESVKLAVKQIYNSLK